MAIAILVTVMLPLAYSFRQEKLLCQAYYYQALAMSIIDGEMEILLAGAWKAHPQGEHEYQTRAQSATNLPPGRFRLNVGEASLKLSWQPAASHKGGVVLREAFIPRAGKGGPP